jgi:hypothetical protein
MTMPGTTLTCGDNCNHVGPHRYAPTQVVWGLPVMVVGDIYETRYETDPDLETPGDPIPEGPEEPTTDPITEDDPRVGHEPVEE